MAHSLCRRSQTRVLTQQGEGSRARGRSSPRVAPPGSPGLCLGPAPPAAGPGRTKRATPIGRGAPRGWQLRTHTANRHIEMQMRYYKRGGASVSRKTRSGKRSVSAVAWRSGARGAGAHRSRHRGSWLRTRCPAGTVQAARTRTAGRRGGTARFGLGPGGRRAVGGCLGPGLSARFPQARKPLVEKKRRARINESLQELRLLLAGAEVRRAQGAGCAGPWFAARSPPGPRRCRPSWRTPRCWS